jgi:hypothetical protein
MSSHIEPEVVTGTPPPAEQEDFPSPAGLFGVPSEDSSAGLFGAALSSGLFDPVPVVAINGVDVASGTGGDLMVIDGLEVTWGRSDVLDQPEPATGRLELFDPSRTWATSADRRGLPVTIRYEGLGPDSTPYSAVFFRGRIGSPVRVSRKNVVIAGQTVRGAVVELPLQSILVDLANTVPRVAYPAESMSARAARVLTASQAAGVLTGGAQLRPYWTQTLSDAAPFAAADQVSLLEHWLAMYESAGSDRLTYIPHTDALFPVQRLQFPSRRGMAQLWWDGSADPARARGGQGIYARSLGVTNPYNPIIDGHALYLDAAGLEYDPADGITTPARITRVSITHPDQAASFADRTIERMVTGADETRTGVRIASSDSIQSRNIFADTALDDLESVVREEGSAWVLEPIRYSTRHTGGFESVLHGQRLLAGYEDLTTIFLQRSFLPETGLRPIYHVMGGVIGYASGGWDLELNVAPPITTLPQHPITWEEIDDGSTTYEVRWHDGDNTRGMHESLTYEDLGYVGQGLNVTTVPADQGFDQ